MIFDNNADEQISAALRKHLGLLSPTEIRAGRKALHLSQRQIAATLGVAEASISRWETGALIHSRAIDNFLRAFFHLPELRAALGTVPHTGADDDCGTQPIACHDIRRENVAVECIEFDAAFPMASAIHGTAAMMQHARHILEEQVLFRMGQN
jgi:DNA-binding transcriptional regulator YiaG